MLNKKAGFYLITFFALAVFLFVLSFLYHSYAATTSSTTSNVTVASSIGLVLSGNLSAGIYFGNVTIGTNDANGSANYLYNDSIYSGANTTAYWIQMAASNNENVDTCISANTHLTSVTTTIGVGNITYDANSSRIGANMNNGASSALLSTSATKFGNTSITAGNNQTIQFYLDIPAAQASGVYNNTITFSIVSAGASC